MLTHHPAPQLALLIEGIDWGTTLVPEVWSARHSFDNGGKTGVRGSVPSRFVAEMGMSLSIADLPGDPDERHRFAGDLQRDVTALSAEVHAKTLLTEKLKQSSLRFRGVRVSADRRESSTRPSSNLS